MTDARPPPSPLPVFCHVHPPLLLRLAVRALLLQQQRRQLLGVPGRAPCLLYRREPAAYCHMVPVLADLLIETAGSSPQQA